MKNKKIREIMTYNNLIQIISFADNNRIDTSKVLLIYLCLMYRTFPCLYRQSNMLNPQTKCFIQVKIKIKY